ncbi:MAG: pseudouridine synthase [Acidobacteriia bacterium]|nr:pseudouridine synthase [Terriglobia bacterium]
MIDGVSPSCKWLPAGPWETVLDFLKERHPQVETATWLSRMARGQVVDETGLCLNPGSPYRVGACIFYYRELESESSIPFVESVLYQDEHLLVVDKPHFLPVAPSGRFLHETLLVRLRKKGGLETLAPIHRIDREAAGVVMFSLNPATRRHYASLFQNRKVKKVYEALAGTLPGLSFPMTRRSRIVAGEPFFRMKEIEGVPNSETYIEVFKKMNGGTLYQVSPVTGRKHQIRLHLSGLGIPIVNDKLYPVTRSAEDDDFSSPLKLLAKSVSFQDPLTRRERYFESGRTL